MKTVARYILAANLKRLMDDADSPARTQKQVANLAKRPGGKRVGQTTVGIMLNPAHPVSPKLDTIEAVAAVFGLESWQLLHPNLGADSAQVIAARLASANPREKAAVYHLLAMEPVSDYDVAKHLPAVTTKPKK